MSVNLSLLAGAGWQFFNDNGVVLSGGKLYTYAAGTTTPQTTYTSATGITPNTNPIVLDAAGRVPEEIWLTASLQYKFVLKTSADVQIWSKDNIIGAADLDSFTADLANSSDPAKGDALVGFRQSNSSGNLTGSVGRTVHQKLQETISFKDFGAVGNGSTNDQAAVQAAITAAGGKTLDGQNLIYKVNAPISLTASNTAIRNATFDFSSMTDQPSSPDRCFTISGTIGAPSSLTANMPLNSATVNVASTTGFAVNDLVFLSSAAIWDSLTSVTYGQYARIKSIDSVVQFTLYDSVLLVFNTANSATVAKVTPVSNVVLDNIAFIGAGTFLQNAVYVEYGENVTINNCDFESFDYLAIGFYRCYQSTIDKCRQRNAAATGTAYAYGIFGGCYACHVLNSWGEDNRHTVTIGDRDGINMFTKVIGCHASGSKDAGFDSHAGSMHTLFMGNHVENYGEQFGSSQHDGLISQGAHTSFIGNTVVNCLGVGINYQPTFQDGTYSGVTISDNNIILDSVGYGTSAAVGIWVYLLPTYGPTVLSGMVIKNNRISGGDNNTIAVYGIHYLGQKASTVATGLIVEGNYVKFGNSVDARPLYIRTNAASTSLSDIVISNNVFRAEADNYAVVLLASIASSTIENITGANNIFDADLAALDINATGVIRKIRLGRNIINAPDIVDNAGATDVLLADTDLNGIFTFTNSTATDFSNYDWYVFDRAGTVTATLPAAATSVGRTLHFKTVQAQTVVSASSNVIPITGGSAGTAILPATDGAWATLYCDGTNWVIIAQ